ncbi:hypothetical protein AVI51_09530 [Piscirickettsia salmonis]|uniref:Uncharacterized protein n=1 Tax=Piscirickettsia salmonis TaxID=1238 RepID=A0A9Q6LT30_PISSA|nr:hypothetical protein [Piscirickettsia salmonis]ALA23692.1 aldo/keto reductase [Piscirickettsia salmonis]APS44130.1 hypothetical protein AVI48_06990 [Piscirickettsia salmonis]APS47491.1 hypothetical protein AVI49_07600 [Piscirickettsia salmonis]APS51074.1 hypothetical protein AVI50_09625 [Piscirickettsia salmonis]APS54282.1 hypothetical protein AVI51_09530 [Piscirickettsia salmonis]
MNQLKIKKISKKLLYIAIPFILPILYDYSFSSITTNVELVNATPVHIGFDWSYGHCIYSSHSRDWDGISYDSLDNLTRVSLGPGEVSYLEIDGRQANTCYDEAPELGIKSYMKSAPYLYTQHDYQLNSAAMGNSGDSNEADFCNDYNFNQSTYKTTCNSHESYAGGSTDGLQQFICPMGNNTDGSSDSGKFLLVIVSEFDFKNTFNYDTFCKCVKDNIPTFSGASGSKESFDSFVSCLG